MKFTVRTEVRCWFSFQSGMDFFWSSGGLSYLYQSRLSFFDRTTFETASLLLYVVCCSSLVVIPKLSRPQVGARLLKVVRFLFFPSISVSSIQMTGLSCEWDLVTGFKISFQEFCLSFQSFVQKVLLVSFAHLPYDVGAKESLSTFDTQVRWGGSMAGTLSEWSHACGCKISSRRCDFHWTPWPFSISFLLRLRSVLILFYQLSA